MGRLTACLSAHLMGCLAPICWSADGSLLIAYDSALGTLPAQQGWSYDIHCLRMGCPQHPAPPVMPGAVSECWFQGANGNDCTLGHGCGPDSSSVSRNEHFNAPGEPVTVLGACTYTEWLAFDDGEDFLDQPFPVALPSRNLTFGSAVPVTYWGPHAHPAFGAPNFLNAPVGYPPLRIVTGGGVPGVDTLPTSGTNKRNTGKINIYRGYSLPPAVQSVTLLAKMACGNRTASNELIGLRGFGRSFSVGVDGHDGSTTQGRFSRGTTRPSSLDFLGTRTVRVAIARSGVWGPHDGEFFTLRIILSSDGSVQAWLNEDPATHWVGLTGTASGQSVLINPDEQAGTMWIDYVQLLEGAVPPGKCGEPTFDVNRDGRVNNNDRRNGLDGFLDCATGPAVPLTFFPTLPDKCECHDSSGDGVIDMIDFAAFQRCFTPVDVPANAACDD